jgi:diketogulonate reductase-like aldo/keto reductase
MRTIVRYTRRPQGVYGQLNHLHDQAGSALSRSPTLARMGEAHGCSAAAVALAWSIRSGNVFAIPESGSVAHVKENAVALTLTLTPQELQTLDAAHPPPSR